MPRCEILTANNRSGDYQPCAEPSTHISRFGWLACAEHASIADRMLAKVTLKELQKRLAHRVEESDLYVQLASEGVLYAAAQRAPEA